MGWRSSGRGHALRGAPAQGPAGSAFRRAELQRLLRLPDRSGARCRPLFAALAGDGASWRIEPQERCMRIDNHWPNGAAFFRSLNKKARNNHTRGKRILTELGGDASFRVIEPGQPADDVIAEM